ncbi:transmembrane protein 101-like [Glandiceps talaboti]
MAASSSSSSSSSRSPTLIVHRIGDFIISRYPYCYAVLLIMLFAERAKHGRPEGYPRQYSYITIGSLFVFGSMIVLRIQRPLGFLLCAIQMLIHTYITHTSKQIHHGEWLSIRMVTRNVAVMGAYLMLASRTTERLPRRSNVHFLFPLGRYIYGLFLICYAYALYHSKEDYRAFTKLVPFGNVLVFAVVAMVAIGGVCFISDTRVRLAAQVLLFVLSFTTLFYEGSINYWTRQKYVEYWNHIVILSETVVSLGVLMLFF